MSVGTFFSDIPGWVKNTMLDRASDRAGGGGNFKNSRLSAWVTATSYCNTGLTIVSNVNSWDYGSPTSNASVGLDLSGNPVSPMGGDEDQGYRPRPIILNLEVDEQNSNDSGQNFSRQATLTIRCFSLGQMQRVAYHFLEPGFTVCLQWGWNEVGMVGGTSGPSATEAANFAEFSNVSLYRRNRSGRADVYLGFITGGDVSFKEDYWDITVKCRGFLELPAFLMAADNAKTDATAAQTEEPQEYSGNEINGATLLDDRRFMMGYNLMPSSKRTKRTKDIYNYDRPDVCRIASAWINVDESVKINLNATTKKQTLFQSIFGGGSYTAKFGTIEAELEKDTELIGEHKYVRLATLLEIVNHQDLMGYKFVNGKKIPLKIKWEYAPCCAFDRIFSTDATKLFIPNANAPYPDFDAIVKNGGTQAPILNKSWDCSVEDFRGGKIEFPERKAAYTGPMDSLGSRVPNTEAVTVPATKYGYVGNLYVNIDFAKSIFETKGLSMKDAVYQLLNGLSSAAGAIWDFQIQEMPVGSLLSGRYVAELRIVDANLTFSPTNPNREFQLTGNKSIFFSADLKFDITQEIANKIIGQRLQAKFNSAMPPVKSKFFGVGKTDAVLNSLDTRPAAAPSTFTATPPTGDELKKIAKADFLKFIKKCTLAPRVEFNKDYNFGDNVVQNCYLCAYDDQALFESLKNGRDVDIQTSRNASVLLDTHITVTTHGVSGLKRGDKLVIDGLPQGFIDDGFFQITGVKQVLQDDYWTSEITGTFRATLSN